MSAVGVNVKIILKWIARKYGRLWTGFTSRLLFMTPCTLVGSCTWLPKIRLQYDCTPPWRTWCHMARIETKRRLLWTRQCTYGLYRKQEISWTAVHLSTGHVVLSSVQVTGRTNVESVLSQGYRCIVLEIGFMIMNMIIFWPVMPYSLMDMYGRFRGTCCLLYYPQVLLETSVHIYQTTRGHLPVHRCLRSHRNEKSKCHISVKTWV
jgi:hypothetical protein